MIVQCGKSSWFGGKSRERVLQTASSMKAAAVAIVQAAVLAVTALTLVATSRPPCSTNIPDTQIFAVTGYCGASGLISVTSDATCTLTVDGGVPLDIPSFGQQPLGGPIRGQNMSLSSSVNAADGGAIPLLDGGSRAFSTLEATGICLTPGCRNPVGNYRWCAGVANDAGVVTLGCTTDDGPRSDSCTATLTPVP